MKFKNLLHLVIVLMAGQLLFACNSARYYEFSAHKQAPYHHLKQKPAPVVTPAISEVALAAAEAKAEEAAAAPVLEANAAVVPVATAPKAVMPKAKASEAVAPVSAAEITVTNEEALAMAKEKIASMTKAEKKELKKELKESLQQRGPGRTSVVEIILAILVPPLAVYLHSGIGSQFWISFLLWLLGVVPGIIYALLVVTDTI